MAGRRAWKSRRRDSHHSDLEGLVLHGISNSDHKSATEIEADSFARNTLVPDNDFNNFTAHTAPIDRQKIISFAAKVGVSPGIVLGRLQHDNIVPWSYQRNLKQSVRFSD